MMSGTLPKLLRRETGMSSHLPDHVRLIGKPRRRGELRPIDIVFLEGLVQSGIELFGVPEALYVPLAYAGPRLDTPCDLPRAASNIGHGGST